ncbi:polysaccharide deacetylase [Nocardia pseudobrasiliensis]|uniref:Polysaccharide deacetylase n=1 Tax=Nocardia pseudobrasiliensis TaxID=45979 RepID=A0A370HWF2_9NOCA|nr:polysaccharide deacetylase [Nocardia pseudobrasiliensis]
MLAVLSTVLVAAVAGCVADTASSGPSPVAKGRPAPSASIAPAAVGANELGVVPILMYHQLSADPAGEYDQTPAKFRAELDRLYREGYRPVTVADYVAGTIDVPAGMHPVVLTFDDSTNSQLAFTPEGGLVPDTAVAILQEFATAHPDFRPRATFYVNNESFGNAPGALKWLVDHGYEVGSHTATHPNLAQLDNAGVQREFADNVRAIETATTSKVHTMALPLGIYPAERALAVEGAADGAAYRFDAVLLVGAEPAPSPYGALDRMGIPRIRSGQTDVAFASTYWLDRLAADPAERYTSDGDPNKISFPSGRATELAPAWAGRANPY